MELISCSILPHQYQIQPNSLSFSLFHGLSWGQRSHWVYSESQLTLTPIRYAVFELKIPGIHPKNISWLS